MNTSESTTSKQLDSSQSDSLSIFCREVRNLLRSKPNCMIPFSKFVPAYHNHYGRQCCVYQFGFTKLIELLEAIPHVVQIVGEGTNRYITLTHREQIKRFASDLIKVVKSQPGKKLKLSQFPKAYEQVLGRQFRVEDYGTNDINVLLAEIWEGTINIIPIRRQHDQQHINSSNGNSSTNSSSTSTSTSSTSTNTTTTTTTDTSATSNSISLSNNQIYSNGKNKKNNNNNNNNNSINSIGQHCSMPSQHLGSNLYSDEQHLVQEEDEQNDELAEEHDVERVRDKHPHLQQYYQAPPGTKPYITHEYPDAWFEIPKRERSEKEIKRTKYFIWDVIELLSNMDPDHSVPFSKFIPSYHYYFNRQCKVSIFGFSKLIDLFESISPDVVEIIDQGPGEEKVIKLAAQHVPSKRKKMSSIVDCGPSEEELLEIEDELQAYEELKAIQSKRSSRMAAILDIFKYYNKC